MDTLRLVAFIWMMIGVMFFFFKNRGLVSHILRNDEE